MTVKKRLAISNIIMIVVPVLITVLAGIICLGGVYITLHNSNGFGFESSDDFYNTSRTISNSMYEIFEHGSSDTKSRLTAIGNIIDKETTFVKVYENGLDFYKSGNEKIADESLMASAKSIGNHAFVSNTEHELYYYTIESHGNDYELYLFSNNNHMENSTVKKMFIISVIVISVAIVSSIVLTNKFLIKFVFKKIEEPLDTLANGVREISNGNLDYRIDYTNDDEFLPVCTAFNDMASRLKKSVELARKDEENRKELLLDISHDLRSPLTSIQAYVEGLIDGVADSPQMRNKYLQTIKRKTTDIERMVSALFAYSKFDMEEFALNEEVISLPSFVNQTVDSIKDEYTSKGLDIEVKSDTKVSVVADEELMIRIISNIIDNSRKYKNKDQAKCEIFITKENDLAKIEFADNGPGIDEKDKDKIFEVFYRTDKARSDTGNGSGIGLAFVKKAVLAMGGTVEARNNKDGGLSIIIFMRCENE